MKKNYSNYLIIAILLAVFSISNSVAQNAPGKVSELQKIETPKWMLDLFKAVDALDFSEDSGFSLFTDDIDMVFMFNHVSGKKNVENFFEKLDAPYRTIHNVKAVYQTGNCYIMQGSADLTSRSDPKAATIHVEPLFNILYMNEDGKVSSYVVSGPPELAKMASENKK